MKMLIRAGLLLSVVCASLAPDAAFASQDSQAAAALAKANSLDPTTAPAASIATGAELISCVQSGVKSACTVAPLLAQLGVRQAGTTIAASTLTIPNDPSQFYLMNSASAQTVTIPSGLTRWVVGNTLTLIQVGAGAVTIAAGAGATIYKSSATLTSRGQYQVISLVNIGADTWVATGGLN